MSRHPRKARPSRAGFTIVEITVASMVLIALWYSITSAMQDGMRSQQVLMDVTAELAEVRRSNDLILEDLSLSSIDAMRIVTLEDGNHQLELQQPIRFEGELSWGVRTPGHSLDDETTGNPDWWIHYTVRAADGGAPNGTRSLVRQILDAEGELQSEQVVITALGGSDAEHPGFSVTQEGEMWKVHLTQANHQHGQEGPGTVFHVRLRN